MPDERWLTVPGWPGYQVSDRGRARSVDRVLRDGRRAGGRMLRPAGNGKGYLYVRLSDGGRTRRVHLARLVLLAHAGPPPTPAHEALHGNGRRRDCRLANLRWGTRAENRADRERHRREREERRAAGAGTAVAAPCVKSVVSPEGETCR